jgi:hypothetical protein
MEPTTNRWMIDGELCSDGSRLVARWLVWRLGESTRQVRDEYSTMFDTVLTYPTPDNITPVEHFSEGPKLVQ